MTLNRNLHKVLKTDPKKKVLKELQPVVQNLDWVGLAMWYSGARKTIA